jgi:hypothetical protein
MKFKTMLNKEDIMLIIIWNVVVVLYQKLFLGGCGICKDCKVPTITYVNYNYYLQGMLMHFLHLIEVLEGIFFAKSIVNKMDASGNVYKQILHFSSWNLEI